MIVSRPWRAIVVAVLLTLVVTSDPGTGPLVAPSTLARRAPAGGALDLGDAPALAAWPIPALAAAVPGGPPAGPSIAAAPDLPVATLPALAPTSAPAPSAGTGVGMASIMAPVPPAVVGAASPPAAMWTQLRRGLTVRGLASWYGSTRGYVGIAAVAMPGARYVRRGARAPRARICVAGRCIVVPVVDACRCYIGTHRARVVDLSAAVLRRLHLDRWRGVFHVRVTLLGA